MGNIHWGLSSQLEPHPFYTRVSLVVFYAQPDPQGWAFELEILLSPQILHLAHHTLIWVISSQDLISKFILIWVSSCVIGRASNSGYRSRYYSRSVWGPAEPSRCLLGVLWTSIAIFFIKRGLRDAEIPMPRMLSHFPPEEVCKSMFCNHNYFFIYLFSLRRHRAPSAPKVSLRIIEVRRHSDDGMALGRNEPMHIMGKIAIYSLDLLV